MTRWVIMGAIDVIFCTTELQPVTPNSTGEPTGDRVGDRATPIRERTQCRCRVPNVTRCVS